MRTGMTVAWLCLATAGAAFAQAPPVVDVRLEQEGRSIDDPIVTRLIETVVGVPVSMRDVRESIAQLMSLGRFEDVRVYQEEVPGGVRLLYDLVPQHPVDRLQYVGSLGVDADLLQAAVQDRFGVIPQVSQLEEVVETLVELYRQARLRARGDHASAR